MLGFENFVILMIMDDCHVKLVIVVLWVIHLYRFVIRHMCSVLLIVLYYILLIVRLKVFYLLIGKKFQKNLQIVCVLLLLVGLFVLCIAHVLKVPFKNEKENPIKLNNAYNKFNLSKMQKGHPRKAKISFSKLRS